MTAKKKMQWRVTYFCSDESEEYEFQGVCILGEMKF